MHTVTIKSEKLAADVTAQQCRSAYNYRKHSLNDKVNYNNMTSRHSCGVLSPTESPTELHY